MTGERPVDLDEYIAALPVRPISAPRLPVPKRYQTSNFPLLKAYNGFDGTERRRGGQLGAWLVAAGSIALPDRCDICGTPGPVGLHGEVYYDVSRDPALCRPCHRAIHFRFRQWDAWRTIVDGSAVTGHEWFALIPRRILDVAQHLRNRWGWRVADIEQSPLMPLPHAVAALLPTNMLPHPQL